MIVGGCHPRAPGWDLCSWGPTEARSLRTWGQVPTGPLWRPVTWAPCCKTQADRPVVGTKGMATVLRPDGSGAESQGRPDSAAKTPFALWDSACPLGLCPATCPTPWLMRAHGVPPVVLPVRAAPPYPAPPSLAGRGRGSLRPPWHAPRPQKWGWAWGTQVEAHSRGGRQDPKSRRLLPRWRRQPARTASCRGRPATAPLRPRGRSPPGRAWSSGSPRHREPPHPCGRPGPSACGQGGGIGTPRGPPPPGRGRP